MICAIIHFEKQLIDKLADIRYESYILMLLTKDGEDSGSKFSPKVFAMIRLGLRPLDFDCSWIM